MPALMKPLSEMLAKPPITPEDLEAAMRVFDKEGKGLSIGACV